jgi:hypothetical protein
MGRRYRSPDAPDPTARSRTLARVIAPTRLLAVLAATALAAPAAAQAQGGAGDDQYQDPFGGSTPKTTKTPPSASPDQRAQVQRKAQSSQPSLSTAPPAQSTRTQTSASSSAPAQASPSTSTGTLPYTGTEIPGMALLGIGILAAGVGLRLRTVDETLY